MIGDIASLVQSKTPMCCQYSRSLRSSPPATRSLCISYNHLLDVIKENLIDVKKALKGQIVMSEELDLITVSLFNNQVPKLWNQKGFLSMKP